MKFLLFAFNLCILPASLIASDLWLGHYELQIDYVTGKLNPDDGWSTSIGFTLNEDGDFTDGSNIGRLDATQFRIALTPSSRKTISSLTSFLGPVNAPVWILEQSRQPGQVFYGWRAIFDNGIFQTEIDGNPRPSPLGSISARLVSVTGTGPDRGGRFAMWTTSNNGFESTAEVHFNSANGIDSNDRLGTIAGGTHQHYNWGFTQPGIYNITFEFAGLLNTGGSTSSRQTFTFVVPFPSELKDGSTLRLGPSGDAAWYDSTLDVEYATNQAALLVDGTSMSATIKIQSNQTPPKSRVGLSGGPIGSGATVSAIELVSSSGPGNVSLTANAADDYTLNFSTNGIFRLKLAGIFNGQTGETIEVVALVGLGLDYSYTQWADSYERTHSLSTGILADSLGDYDHDGIPNAAEFQLFWHGTDPVLGTSEPLPPAQCSNGTARFYFLRDLHKDDYFSTPLELLPAHADSPAGPWNVWQATTNRGTPISFTELGAPLGNETGAISRRTLQVPTANPNIGFFRFHLRNRN